MHGHLLTKFGWNADANSHRAATGLPCTRVIFLILALPFVHMHAVHLDGSFCAAIISAISRFYLYLTVTESLFFFRYAAVVIVHDTAICLLWKEGCLIYNNLLQSRSVVL